MKVDDCPLCEREMIFASDHHLVPKTRGGKATVTICCDCHNAIHALFSNKELEREYHTVEALKAHETFKKTLKFLATKDPARRFRSKLSKNQKRRGRNG